MHVNVSLGAIEKRGSKLHPEKIPKVYKYNSVLFCIIHKVFDETLWNIQNLQIIIYPSVILMCKMYKITCIFGIEEKHLARRNCTPKVKIIFRTHLILYLEILLLCFRHVVHNTKAKIGQNLSFLALVLFE